MHHRQLSRGEVSVCLKHFYAISSVACGDGPFGLVVEDDIGHLDTSNAELKTILNECYRFNIDFADIVGGCMLEPTRHEMQNKHISTNLCKINPSRTRTLAGYILSKNFAIDIVNSFFPLVMPIDWHIQYIMSESTNINAYWATRPVFTHGSEIGLFDSWRK